MKYSTIAFLTLLIIASACSSPNSKNAATEKPVLVTVSNIISADTGSIVNASGKLVAKNKATVSTRMMGYITRMHVQVGQAVKEGQLLVNINNTDLVAKSEQVSAQINQALAAFNNAKKDYERFLNLYNSQSATAKELDDMRTRYEMAEASLQATRQMKNEINAQFSYSNITAPISGVVTQAFVKQGDMANPGMPLLTIESPSQLQAEVLVPEKYITLVKQGIQVLVIQKTTGAETKGSVSEVSLSAANTGGQFLVKINLNQSEKNLLPGMIVQVQFPVQRQNKTNEQNSGNITVPIKSLIHKGQLTGIYTISQAGTAILRWVRTGNTIGDDVEVLSGLSANERFIMAAEGKLYHGVKVQVK